MSCGCGWWLSVCGMVCLHRAVGCSKCMYRLRHYMLHASSIPLLAYLCALLPQSHSSHYWQSTAITIRVRLTLPCLLPSLIFFFFFFQAEDGIRDYKVTGVQTCALPI